MNTKIDFTKPLQTRDGRPATLISVRKATAEVRIDGAHRFVYLDGSLSRFAEGPLDLFNVPEPVIDWSKPVETLDGRPVRLLCTDAGTVTPIIGLVPGTYETDDNPVRFNTAGASVGGSLQLRNVKAKPLEVTKVLSVYRSVHTGFVWVDSNGVRCPGDGAELLGSAEVSFTLQHGPDGRPI